MERRLGNISKKNSWEGSWGAVLLAAMVVLLFLPGEAQAQKKQKEQPIDPNATMPQIQLPTPDQIDKEISEMLGAFQLGDMEKMHTYYAENATFVSGAYAPPVEGWQRYAAAYQQERASFQGLQIVRRNTSIFHSGDVAWASYQWELAAMYAGKPYFAKGQTTLVFVKTGDTWLIVHNHTSQVCPNEGGPITQPTANPAPAPQPKP
jgi:ketosteroid isomerase-like protein